MKSTTTVLTSVLAAAFTASFAYAADAPPKPAGTITPTPATTMQPKPIPSTPPRVPVDLGNKRGELFGKTLLRAGFPALQIQPPPAHARLTPMAPSGAGGAKFVKVGRALFIGATTELPDGAYQIEPPPAGPNLLGNTFAGLTPEGATPSGRIEMQFPVEGSKLYMLDCRMYAVGPNNAALPSTNTVGFSRAGSAVTQQVSGEDGHYLYPFRADATGPLSIALGVREWSYFFGCELSKLN